MNIRPGDRKWLILAVALYGLMCILVSVYLGEFSYLVWLVASLPLGYVLGRTLKRRHKQYRVEEWRKTHPGMPDIWLPAHLKEKAKA